MVGGVITHAGKGSAGSRWWRGKPSELLFALLVASLSLGLFAFDVLAVSGAALHGAVYVFPILVAAFLLPRRLVVAATAWCAALEALAAYLHPTPPWLAALYVVAIATVGYLSLSLVARSRLEAAVAAQQELLAKVQTQQALLEAVLEQMPSGVLVAEPSGKVIVANEQLKRIWNLSSTPTSTQQAYHERRGLHADGQAYRLEEWPLLRSLASGEAVAGEAIDIVRSDGTPGAIAASSTPIRDQAGRVVAAVAVYDDITEEVQARRRAEELAQVAQRRNAELQAIIESMASSVIVCDAQGRITLVNEASHRLFGLDVAREAKGGVESLADLFFTRRADGRPVPAAEEAICRALAGEVVQEEERIIYSRAALRDLHIRTSAAPIRSEAGQIVGAVAVTRDVTELTELERLKDQFIATAAHELKTPVTIMKGYAQVLLRSPQSLAPEQQKMLESVDRGADRINRIVRDLLDISRLQSGSVQLRVEWVDLPSLIEDIVGQARLTSKCRIRIVSVEQATVEGDRERLGQVLANLLDNAIKYSPQRGDIDLRLVVQSGEVILSVTDRGVGISREKQQRIFERFYRAHTGTIYDFGGIGVGLYISRLIVERHGGRMWFTSEEGKGSTFYVALPTA